jgi:hypothetical protein
MLDHCTAHFNEILVDLQAMVAAGVFTQVTGFDSIEDYEKAFVAGWYNPELSMPEYALDWADYLRAYRGHWGHSPTRVR